MTRLSSTAEPWYRALRTPRGVARTPPCIHTALAERARAEPGRALLVDAHGYVTQRELLDRIATRARQLRARCPAGEHSVAVALEPGVELVVSYFACLAAGLRYLPVPADARLAQRLLEQLAPSLLVTRRALERPAHVETLLVDADAPAPATHIALPEPDPYRIAHVLATSGTATGDPKAVLTDHVGSMRSHAWRAQLLADDPARDVVGCNIFGIWDVVPALLNGIPLVMLTDATMRDAFALASMIVRYGITRIMLTPTLLDACLSSPDGLDALARLRRIVLCGEPVTQHLVTRAREALPDVGFTNLYSLAECHDVAAGELEAGARVTSGHVADFAEVHVTEPDDRARLVPAGAPGRVLIGGAALAAGYTDPALTAERFLDVRFGPGERPQRVYDSGDLGVLHADGMLEIRGRVDDAVKVRGAWAEPEAVEAVLREHPDVARAAVIASAGARGHAQLVAFVVAHADAPAGLERALRNHVRERVGESSVPARITRVAELPLAPSGKIDTRRLRTLEGPQAQADEDTRAAEAAPAADAAEARAANGAQRGLGDYVLEAVRTVLAQPNAAYDDDLETLGADSLARLELAAELERATGRRVRVAELTPDASAASIAAALGPRLQGPRSQPQAHAQREAWQLPELELDIDPQRAARSRSRIEHVLVTGATGTLGRALVRRLLGDDALRVTALARAPDAAAARARIAAGLDAHCDTSRLEAVAGDLGAPRLGLAAGDYAALTEPVDAVVHAGAAIDMFAGYAALAPVNVGGTRRVLEFAAAAGARCIHVSSSAALPLESGTRWDETSHGVALAETLAPRLAGSDGYSRTKLAAEALVWRAAERGLDVTAVRVPHLVGRGVDSRLADTLAVLRLARIVPEGPWAWQLAPVDAVAARIAALLERPAPAPLMHVATRRLRGPAVAAALRACDARMRVVSMPAAVTALARTQPRRESARRLLASVDRLVSDYGPRAALSLADAELETREPLADEPEALLAALIEATNGESTE